MAAIRCDICGKHWIMEGDRECDQLTPVACPYCGQVSEFSIIPGAWNWELAALEFENGWAEPKGKA